MNPYWCSLRWLFGPSSPRRPVPSASPYFLAPPESIDSTWHDEDYGIEHIGPKAENGIEEGEQDGRRGEARSDDHAAAGHPDEPIVEARLHQMMMERSVPERQVHRNLDGQEIEPVGHDGHWLERMVSIVAYEIGRAHV